MTTRPIIRPKLDIVKLTGAVGVTEEKTVEKIKALELEIHRETTRGKLPDEIKPMRDDLVCLPGLGHQGSLELLAHMGMFFSEFDKNNAGVRERHYRIKKQKLLRRAEKLNECEFAFQGGNAKPGFTIQSNPRKEDEHVITLSITNPITK